MSSAQTKQLQDFPTVPRPHGVLPSARHQRCRPKPPAPRTEPCGFPCYDRQSTQAQQNKILISGTIGAFRSGKRGAAACGSRPGSWAATEIGVAVPTENTVSADTAQVSYTNAVAGSRHTGSADENATLYDAAVLKPPGRTHGGATNSQDFRLGHLCFGASAHTRPSHPPGHSVMAFVVTPICTVKLDNRSTTGHLPPPPPPCVTFRRVAVSLCMGPWTGTRSSRPVLHRVNAF